MKRQLTAEQKARSDERKARLGEIIKQVAAMSPEQKSEIASKMGAVVNVEGHALSLRNTILLAMQGHSSATIVGGFRQWIGKGRVVRKGEHGSTILFPCNPKKDEGKQEGEISSKEAGGVYFRSATVFDVSQTEEMNTGETGEFVDARERGDNGTFKPMQIESPRLLNGERQGDLISSTQREDFALVSETTSAPAPQEQQTLSLDAGTLELLPPQLEQKAA